MKFFPHDNPEENKKHLFANGLYIRKKDKKVVCNECGFLEYYDDRVDLLKYHDEEFLYCKNTQNRLSIQIDKNFYSYEKRLETFIGKYNNEKASLLAKSGLYYISPNIFMCCCCAFKLNVTSYYYDIVSTHAEYSLYCKFLNRGIPYVV